MYGENRLNDVMRVLRGAATNILAGLAPRLYISLTRQTGRGSADLETACGIADYFQQCFNDYLRVLGLDSNSVASYLNNKLLLEYGPGDVPGVALLMIAHGARRVVCVDRFPLYAQSEKGITVLKELLDRLPGNHRERANACFRVHGDPVSGFNPDKVAYLVHPNGLSGLNSEIDLVYSRAVLEHVNNLSATFSDMHDALKPQGLAIHQVDLKSHGLHRRNRLDFLTWPQPLWNAMFSHKGVPNRWRVDAYRRAIDMLGFEKIRLEPIERALDSEIEEVRPYLARPFRHVSTEDLSWLSFWLVCRHPPNAPVVG